MDLTSKTLAEVFLEFSGQTMFVLGTACTALGVIYGVNKLTGHGISVLSNLPKLLGMEPTTNSNEKIDYALVKQKISSEATAYAKLFCLILFGITIKFCGTKLYSKDTVALFQGLLYGK